MILTVTTNPMLDKTVEVRKVRRGAVERAARVSGVVGGKGVNVSRQLAILGVDTLAAGFAGGEIGTMLERLLDEEALPHALVRIGGMTREGVTYREADGTITAVFEPPHRVTLTEARKLVRNCTGYLPRCSWVVCSGSSPCREADGIFRELLQRAAARGVPTVLDSYGPALREGLGGHPTVIKLNRSEYEQTFGERLRRGRDPAPTLRRLLDRTGAEACILTDGPGPVTGVTEDKTVVVLPPRVKSVNPTGSGDSMLAGVLYGLLRGWSFARALRFGAAAGAANARRWDVAVGRLAEIRALERRTRLVEHTIPFFITPRRKRSTHAQSS